MKPKELRKRIDAILQEEVKQQENLNDVILDLAKEKDNQALLSKLECARKESMGKIYFLKDCLAIIDDPTIEERIIVDGMF